MTSRRIPLSIIPDFETLPPGYESVPVAMSLGEFRLGPGIVTLDCLTMRQYLNVQRMLQLYAEGYSPLLTGRGITSEDILFQTGVSHELRHCHDCLLSFSFLEATRRKLFLASNMVSTFGAFRGEDDHRLFPVPLMDWMMADDEARDAAMEPLRVFYEGVDLSIFDLPHFSLARLKDLTEDPDPLRNGLLACVRAAFSIDLLFNREPLESGPSPSDIFELSAVSTQFLTITDRFGFRTAEDIFRTSFVGTYYDHVLDLMAQFLHGNRERRIAGPDALMLASAMSLTAICSAPPAFPTDPRACPSVRFARLWALMLERRSEVLKRLHNIEDLLSFFDDLLKEPSLKERVAQGTDYFERVTQEAKSRWEEIPPHHPATTVMRYWEELLFMRKELHRVALDDVYFHLRGAYESARANQLVLPPIIVNYIDLDPQSYADDPLASKFTKQLQGREVIFRVSDRMNVLKDEIHFVEEVDMLVMKIFFDIDLTRSDNRRRSLHHAVRTLLGRRWIALPELRGSAMKAAAPSS